MAENTRGQNGQKKRKAPPSGDSQRTSLENDRQQSTDRGLTDMEAEPSTGRSGIIKASGIGSRSSITDSYFDGRLSDE